MKNNKINFTLIQVICIIILGFFVYANSLNGQFLWDDYCYVKENSHIKDFSHLPGLFVEDVGAGDDYPSFFYRPLQMFTYMLNYSFHGLNVFGYHFINIGLHVIAALAVYWLVGIIFCQKNLAFLTALLFVAHPTHTEAIASISGRADPLSAALLLFCIIFYLKDKPLVAAISFILALLSKESSLVAPLLILLYHYTFKKKVNLKAFLLLLAIALIYIIFRVFILHSLLTENLMPYTPDFPAFLRRIPGFFVATVNYLRIILMPVDLRAHYGERLFYFTNLKSVLGLLLICFLIIYALRKRRKNKLIFFSILWFFITLLPSANIYKINFSFMKEHWLYLPSIGCFLLVSKSLLSFFKVKLLQPAAVVFIVILLFTYSFLTIKQNNYWQNGIVFMKRSLYYLPDCPIFYNELGREYRNMGRYDEAIEHYKTAIQLNPNSTAAYFNLADLYKMMGKNKEAAVLYEEIIRIGPARAGTYYQLGDLYDRMGRKREACGAYEKTIEINPGYLEAYNNLAAVYVDQGRIDEAIGLWNKAVEIKPDFAIVHFNLAVFYAQQKKHDLAIKHCDKVMALGFKVDPKFLKVLEEHRK